MQINDGSDGFLTDLLEVAKGEAKNDAIFKVVLRLAFLRGYCMGLDKGISETE